MKGNELELWIASLTTCNFSTPQGNRLRNRLMLSQRQNDRSQHWNIDKQFNNIHATLQNKFNVYLTILHIKIYLVTREASAFLLHLYK